MEQPFPLEHLTRPPEGEKLSVPTLIVGDTLAAYTATLAALRGGDQVCWVTTTTPGQIASHYTQALLGSAGPLLARSSRHRLPSTHFAISLSQRQWRERTARPPESQRTAPLPSAASLLSAGGDFSTGMAAYLQNQQLMIIPHARPLLILFKDHRGQRQVTQVLFQDLKTRHRFSVQADITLEATHTGDLSRQVLTTTQSSFQVSRPDLLVPLTGSAPRQARGYSFTDSLGIGHGRSILPLRPWLKQGAAQGSHLPPITLPAHAFVQPNLQGLLFSGPNLTWNHRLNPAPSSETIAALLASPAVEWATGEAAGHLAAFSHQQKRSPQSAISDPKSLRIFQITLLRYGIPLFWFDDIAQDDPHFEAIQMLAVMDVIRTTSQRDLHFRPEVPVSRAVLTAALVRLMRALDPDKEYPAADPPAFRDVPLQHWAYPAIGVAVSQGWMLPLRRDRFLPSRVVTHRQLYSLLARIVPEGLDQVYQTTPVNDRPVRRRELAQLLYGIFCLRLGI